MQELVIRSESVQRLYGFYREKRLVVNRRYQRKLVWSVDEKAAFIDSIMKEYPVPLFLFAEYANRGESTLEIIDGMQRLNAIVSFIENEFPVNGYYFDLEATAETKLMKDQGILIQKEPVLDRRLCAENIAAYVLPISSYRSSNEDTIDEVFRRINANGKHLSRQEIRQAGAISSFAEAVRKIASEIRGDVSLDNRLLLNDMQKISITSRELSYGIRIDELFWVKNGIIRREQVRESKDEEIVADIVAVILLEDMPPYSSKVLDEYYALTGDGKRAHELDERLQLRGFDSLHADFFTVYDEIKSLLQIAGKSMNELISKSRTFESIPRYFTVIFLAMYNLLIRKNLKVVSQYEILKVLEGITDSIKLSQGGGNWSATERDISINGITGILNTNKCFAENTEDPANVKWSTELETILKQSIVEQTHFDFKLGCYTVATRAYNERVLKKSIMTLTAMANRGYDEIGYVVMGVADKEEDALALQAIDAKYTPIKKDGYYITGVDFDIDCSGLTADRYYQNLIQQIRQMPIDPAYASYICKNIKFIRYGEKNVIILKIQGLTFPAIYDEDYYERLGANVEKITPRNMPLLFSRFPETN